MQNFTRDCFNTKFKITLKFNIFFWDLFVKLEKFIRFANNVIKYISELNFVLFKENIILVSFNHFLFRDLFYHLKKVKIIYVNKRRINLRTS